MFNFITNVVSHKRLKAAGYRLDDERNVIIQNNGDIFRMHEMYGQTVIHYKAATPAAFPATTATKANTATTATTATGLPTDPPAVVTPVTAPPATVPISSRKPLKNRPTDGMTWHLRCSHPSKEALESMVKRATKDKIEVFIIL